MDRPRLLIGILRNAVGRRRIFQTSPWRTLRFVQGDRGQNCPGYPCIARCPYNSPRLPPLGTLLQVRAEFPGIHRK